MRTSNILFVVVVFLFSAIFQFGRLKFDRDPVVDLPFNVQVLNGFRTQFYLQNRIHVSKLKNYRSEISFLE